MYEFLAPWGMLAPALCFLASYFPTKTMRRNKLMETVYVAEQTVFLSGEKPRSKLGL